MTGKMTGKHVALVLVGTGAAVGLAVWWSRRNAAPPVSSPPTTAGQGGSGGGPSGAAIAGAALETVGTVSKIIGGLAAGAAPVAAAASATPAVTATAAAGAGGTAVGGSTTAGSVASTQAASAASGATTPAGEAVTGASTGGSGFVQEVAGLGAVIGFSLGMRALVGWLLTRNNGKDALNDWAKRFTTPDGRSGWEVVREDLVADGVSPNVIDWLFAQRDDLFAHDASNVDRARDIIVTVYNNGTDAWRDRQEQIALDLGQSQDYQLALVGNAPEVETGLYLSRPDDKSDGGG
jgi:hypothetical protein